tara:strand:+ start:618 stop:1049 length:432 start_codon:yes stop_codon:yes gene_type:complete
MQRHLSFKVKGNKYDINFPTVAQFIDIESMKSKLSNDTYGSMVKTGTILSVKALDYIDMVSNLTVMIPDLLKDLKTDNYLNLDIFDARELLKAYQSQYAPWMVQWQKILAEIPEDESSEEDIVDEVISDEDITDAERIAANQK